MASKRSVDDLYDGDDTQFLAEPLPKRPKTTEDEIAEPSPKISGYAGAAPEHDLKLAPPMPPTVKTQVRKAPRCIGGRDCDDKRVAMAEICCASRHVICTTCLLDKFARDATEWANLSTGMQDVSNTLTMLKSVERGTQGPACAEIGCEFEIRADLGNVMPLNSEVRYCSSSVLILFVFSGFGITTTVRHTSVRIAPRLAVSTRSASTSSPWTSPSVAPGGLCHAKTVSRRWTSRAAWSTSAQLSASARSFSLSHRCASSVALGCWTVLQQHHAIGRQPVRGLPSCFTGLHQGHDRGLFF